MTNRGMERRAVFLDDRDRSQFLKVLQKGLEKTKTNCFAWALMPNHFHLLLRTGEKPISWVLHSLQTSYAVYFNQRHKRAGRLFQNRFYSKLCETEEYFLAALRYIHRNPLEAKIVHNMEELDSYVWSGHAALMGNIVCSWQSVEETLGHFSEFAGSVPLRENYREFVANSLIEKDGNAEECRLVRGRQGSWIQEGISVVGQSKGDTAQRICGNSSAVENVFLACQQREDQRSRLRREGWNAERVLERVCQILQLRRDEIIGPEKRAMQCRGRALMSVWMVDSLGHTVTETAKLLAVSHSTVIANLQRGRELALEMGVDLENPTI